MSLGGTVYGVLEESLRESEGRGLKNIERRGAPAHNAGASPQLGQLLDQSQVLLLLAVQGRLESGVALLEGLDFLSLALPRGLGGATVS